MASSNTASQPIVIPAMTPEEEDQINLARITSDDRPLRRMIKKFHTYASLSHPPIVPILNGGNSTTTSNSSVEEAREAFLIELSSFQLLMQKNTLICEEEARQVEEYNQERQRLDNEHETLKLQIEELKVALEHAQMLRRRKIEYDLVAEKVNALPSREELESSILALENDMTAIRSEHETQNRILHGQKSALGSIISDISALRFMGKETEAPSLPQSLRATPAPEGAEVVTVENSVISVNAEESEEKLTQEAATEPAPSEGMIEEENDIEMGEVEEDPKEKNNNKKKAREEMEEGEATDASSELSDPPDD